ncbi:MAG: efflux RND transporter periplasmic adaptor subunit [Acidobacteriota bacterium]
MKQPVRILLPFLVLAGGVLAAVLIARAKPEVEKVSSTSPPPLVETVSAERTAARLDVTSQGTVMPHTETTLVAQVAGRVEWVSPSFAEGGFFGRGDLLLRLERADYELALSQAEAMVAQAASRLELATAEAEVAREEWRELGNGEANALVLRKPQLAEARAALAAAEANLEKAQLDLRRTRITAPFTGRVAGRQVDLGQFVAPGTPLAAIFGTEVAEVRLPVSQSDLEFLDISLGAATGDDGPAVRLKANLAGEAAEWPARVVRTGGAIDARTRMIDLIAQVDDPFRRRAGGEGDPALPMGLFVGAEIAGRAADGVFLLPRAALREGERMMVVEGGDTLAFRQVEVARTQGETVIVESGLEDGDAVVVSPLVTAVDGMKVRIEGEASS